ncbi:MAG: hypothetical protein L0Z50_39395 [Verrucomicrobiales bacterium]|nr:hypothetical protein [Verrucomicrobiales bacterium]
MKTRSKSYLKLLTVGCVLSALLFQSARSLRGDTKEIAQNKFNIAGTWSLSIRYTGGDDRFTDAPKRASGPVKGAGVPFNTSASKSVSEWITARFISFRATNPPPGNLGLSLQQEGEKVAGTYSAPKGRQKVSGTLKGNDVSFSVALTNDVGERITGRFTGELLSSGKMEGTVTYDAKTFFDVAETRLGPAKSKEDSANETPDIETFGY